MGNDTNGWSEGGAAAWKRDAAAAPGRMKMDLDTSVTAERTGLPAGNLSNPGTGANRSAPADGKTLMNKIAAPKPKTAKGPAGVTKAKGKR